MPKKAALWLRFYVDTPDDPKVRSLPKGDRWIWAAVLSLARESPEPGRLLIKDTGLPITAAQIADKAGPGYTAKEADAALGRFVDRGMAHREGEVWVCTNFRRRQFLSDSSTPRVQAHRDRLRNGDETADETVNGTPDVTTNGRSFSHAGARTFATTESRDQRADLATSDHPAKRQPSEPTEKPAPSARTTHRAAGSLEPGYSAEFEAFWQRYPKKRDKVDAFSQFEKTLRLGATAEMLETAAGHFAAYCDEMGTEDSFIPYPATWLNRRSYLDFRDGPPKPRTGSGRRRNGAREVPAAWDQLRELQATRTGADE